jgi:predicted signal transduction protein with EAL and GGDEF domain
VPLLYTIAFVNFLGLVFASGAESFRLFHPANFLIVLIAVRFIHWARISGAQPPPARILKELKRTLVLAGLLSIGFAYASIELFFETHGYVQQFVILFATLAAVGCAYGLTSFPAAARLPLLLFAMPFALTLTLSSTPAHIGVGVSLALLTLLILRLVALHNDSFVQLVWSRSEVETERVRAQRAERAALAEKARVRVVADTDPLTGLANRRAFIAELH